jgi:AcrR family transcriptional regulator
MPETRLDPRRTRTMRALLEAAARLFAEHGFAAVTVEQIASEAEVAIGSIYGNFGDKRGLYLAAVDAALDVNDAYQLAIFESDMLPIEKLAASGAAYVRFYLEHPGHFRLVQLALPEPGEGPQADAAAAIHLRVHRIIELMAETLEEAIADGTARRLPPLPTARFLWASLTGAVALNLKPGVLRITHAEVAELAQLGQMIIAEGIAGPGFRTPEGLLAPEVRERVLSITAQGGAKGE